MLKKRCKNCNKKIDAKSNFCPYCGFPQKNVQDKFGMLGIADNSLPPKKKGFISGLSDRMLDKMIASTMRILEKELVKNFNALPPQKTPKIKVMITNKKINNKQVRKKKNDIKSLPINFSNENLKKWKELPKEEPPSRLKRIENKIQYEMKIPEVNSIEDISIVNLENSIEVKAIGKTKGYKKVIPLNLPLKRYSLLKGILTLELDTTPEN